MAQFPSLKQLDVFGEGPQLCQEPPGTETCPGHMSVLQLEQLQAWEGPWGKPSLRRDKAQPTALVALEKITLGTAVPLFASAFHLQGTVQ